VGRVEVVECLKIFLVFFFDVGIGEKVDGYRCAPYLRTSADTCAGYVMGFGG
jgi:hypothetical protein